MLLLVQRNDDRLKLINAFYDVEPSTTFVFFVLNKSIINQILNHVKQQMYWYIIQVYT